jgi:hypothetical protein
MSKRPNLDSTNDSSLNLTELKNKIDILEKKLETCCSNRHSSPQAENGSQKIQQTSLLSPEKNNSHVQPNKEQPPTPNNPSPPGQGGKLTKKTVNTPGGPRKVRLGPRGGKYVIINSKKVSVSKLPKCK